MILNFNNKKFRHLKLPFLKKFLLFLVIIILGLSQTATSARALSLAVYIPEKYSVVKVGERLYFELEIRYPENVSRKDLRLEYKILENNEVIARSQILKAVETQASFVDYIIIPASARSGLHEVRVQIKDYQDLNEEVSASFQIVSNANELKLYFGVFMFVFLLFAIVIFLQIKKLKEQIKIHKISKHK